MVVEEGVLAVISTAISAAIRALNHPQYRSQERRQCLASAVTVLPTPDAWLQAGQCRQDSADFCLWKEEEQMILEPGLLKQKPLSVSGLLYLNPKQLCGWVGVLPLLPLHDHQQRNRVSHQLLQSQGEEGAGDLVLQLRTLLSRLLTGKSSMVFTPGRNLPCLWTHPDLRWRAVCQTHVAWQVPPRFCRLQGLRSR